MFSKYVSVRDSNDGILFVENNSSNAVGWVSHKKFKPRKVQFFLNKI